MAGPRLGDVLKDVQAGRLAPVYFLAGEDRLSRERVLKAVLDAAKPDDFNRQEFAAEGLDAGELVSSARTPPMFSERRVIVLKRADALHAAHRKALAEYLEEPLATTVLVLLHEGKPAKGDVLEAAARERGVAAVFQALSEEETVAWALRASKANGLPLNEAGARALVEEAGTDLAILQQELGKLAQFAKDRPGELGEAEVLASLGYRRPESVFELGRAVQRRDLKEALRLVERLLEDETPFRVLYQVSGALQKQLAARRVLAAGGGEEEAFRAAKVHRFYDRDFVRLAKGRAEAALVQGLERCLEAEARMKSNPAVSPRIELEQLVVEVCGGKA